MEDEIEKLINEFTADMDTKKAACLESQKIGNTFAAYTEISEARTVFKIIQVLKILQQVNIQSIK